MEGLKNATLILEEHLKEQMKADQIKNGRCNEVSWVNIPNRGNGIRKGIEACKCTASH